MLAFPAGSVTVARDTLPKPVWLANACCPLTVTEAVPVSDNDSA